MLERELVEGRGLRLVLIGHLFDGFVGLLSNLCNLGT